MTDRDREIIGAVKKYGSHRKAAAALGIHHSQIDRAVAKAKMDPAVAAAMEAAGTEINPALMWIKTKREDGASYSVMIRPDKPDAEDIAERMRDLFADVSPWKPRAAPTYTNADLLTLIPLFDVHWGMRATAAESGEDYDLTIVQNDLRESVGQLVEKGTPSSQCVILAGGDFFHTNDQSSETYRSKHKLDNAGQIYDIVDTAVMATVDAITLALARHDTVTYRVIPGNHDPTLYMMLMFSLHAWFRNEPRVHVVKAPDHYWVETWGRTLLAAHHGNGVTPERLAFWLCEHPDYMPRHQFRHFFVGHEHNPHKKPVGPIMWERMAPFCSRDAHAAASAYGNMRFVDCIEFHRERGESGRFRHPLMRA